jgi:hypothetical protein
MKVEFVRFNATDDVELQGWLNNENGEVAVVHIHGMSGNGYENYFLDDLRKMYANHGNTLVAALRFLRKVSTTYRGQLIASNH